MTDDDYDLDDAYDDEDRRGELDHDCPDFGCILGADCLNPHVLHTTDECFDLEMAEAAMGGEPEATSITVTGCAVRAHSSVLDGESDAHWHRRHWAICVRFSCGDVSRLKVMWLESDTEPTLEQAARYAAEQLVAEQGGWSRAAKHTPEQAIEAFDPRRARSW